MYKIQPYTKQKAKQLNVLVEPSLDPKYKIDVFDKATKRYITSCGAKNYNDFSTYLELEKNGQIPTGYAQNRRRLYHLRHHKEADKIGTRGWYALELLW